MKKKLVIFLIFITFILFSILFYFNLQQPIKNRSETVSINHNKKNTLVENPYLTQTVHYLNKPYIITETPSKKPFITEYPRLPTISPEIMDEWDKQIENNNGCDLPCFMGITPGKTRWSDAYLYLQKFVNYDISIPYTNNKLPSVNLYSIDLSTNNDQIVTTYFLKLEVENDIVQRMQIDFDILRKGESSALSTKLQRYSIKNLFLHEGKPDKVIINTSKLWAGYFLDIVYLKKKINVSYSSFPLRDPGNIFICPNIGNEQISLMRISLENPSGSENILKYGPIDMRGSDHLNYEDEGDVPIEKAIGWDVNSFYQFILDNDNPCFKIKTNE